MLSIGLLGESNSDIVVFFFCQDLTRFSALWEYEARRRRLPRGEEDQSLVAQHAKDLRETLGVNEKAFKGQLEAEEGAIVE